MSTRLISPASLAVALCFALLLLPFEAPRAGEDAILLIEQTSGVAGVQRDGKRLALNPGEALQEQDLIVTDRSGRMTLRLGRHGFVEVGPNAEVGIERLPFATYARDLKSIFSVSKGYFRVVWKHPQLSSSWPLYVYMSGHRISLVGGEYFFHNAEGGQRACVAAGQIALQAEGSEGVETIKAPSCVQLTPGRAPQVAARSPDDWIAVRRAFSIEATAVTLLARENSPPLPPPAAAIKPVIYTTPAVIAAAPPAPVALPPPVAMPQYTAPAATAVPFTTTAPIVLGQTPPPAAAAVIAKPAAAPAAALVPAVAVRGNGGWALNVASYSEAASAEREAARLRAAGFSNAVAQPALVNGKAWHRVQLAGFASETVARSTAEELAQKLGLKNIWVLKP